MYTPGSLIWTGAHHGFLWFPVNLVALSKFVRAIKLLRGTQNYWYCDHGERMQLWEEIFSIQKAICRVVDEFQEQYKSCQITRRFAPCTDFNAVKT